MKNDYIEAIALLLIAVFILSCVLFAGYKLKQKQDRDFITTYNNGICKRCGGNYRYLQAVGHIGRTTYIYVCDGCNRTLETPKYFGQ